MDKKELYILAKKEYCTTIISLSKLCKKFKIDRGSFTNWIKSQGIQVVNKQNTQTIYTNYFNVIDTEEKAYWLGFLFADGYVSKNSNNIELSLKSSDYTHLLKFAKCINFTNNISKDDIRCRICFASKQMKLDLIDKGCIPQKSLSLKPPKNVPKNLIIHFIRGYFDGDGCIHFKNGKSHLPIISMLGTKDFLNFVSNELIGFSKNLSKNNKSDNTLVLSFSGKNSRNILKILYNNSNLYLDRKFHKFSEMKIALLDSNIQNALSKYGGF